MQKLGKWRVQICGCIRQDLKVIPCSGLSSVARERAPASLAPSGAGEGGVAHSQRTSLALSASSVVSPHSSPHTRRRGELREISEDRSLVLSSRGSRSSDRGARKDKRARSWSSSSRDRGRRSRSRSSSRSLSRGRERRRRSSSRSLSFRVRLRRGRSRSSDRYRSRRMRSHFLGGTGLARIALGVTGRGLLTATGHIGSVRIPQLAGEVVVTARGHAISRVDLVTSRDRRPSSPDRSRSGEKGWLARRDQQEGGETVEVSQAPAVSEASTGVTPVAGAIPLSALPSAVQDLARFFLNLSGSSSLGAVDGVAGMAASTVGVSGSVVPFDFCSWCSRTWCCDCDACWSW